MPYDNEEKIKQNHDLAERDEPSDTTQSLQQPGIQQARPDHHTHGGGEEPGKSRKELVKFSSANKGIIPPSVFLFYIILVKFKSLNSVTRQ